MLNQNLLWSLPPADLVLSSNDVHVWRASLEQPTAQVQQLAQTLSEDERLRAERFYFERDRKHFIVGRGLLRTIIARYLVIEPSQLQFSYSPHGKPALAGSAGSTLQFNLSHSQGLALYAFTRDSLSFGEPNSMASRRIGIDVEYIRSIPNVEQLAKRFFSSREHAIICSLSPSQQQEAFFHGWTCKEAYLKATGEGLTQLGQVEVSLTPGEPRQLLSIGKDSQAAARWSLQALTPAPDYVATLAVEGHDWHLSCWQWSTEV